MDTDSPLIVSLQLDDASFSFFNALRKTYFPAAINYLSAHLTLFHHLPPNEPVIMDDLKYWSESFSILPLDVTEVRGIGKGVAYKIDSPALQQLHKRMQEKWQQWLTPQDRQKLWPHVTVQNKVSPTEAQQTLKTLQDRFQPFNATGIGFQLWSYEGGPWTLLKNFPFLKT